MEPRVSTFYILLGVRGTEEHCTIACMGNRKDLTDPIYELVHNHHKLSYCTAVITGTDNFGKNNDIPVFLIKFLCEGTKEYIDELWYFFDTKEYSQYTPHITKQKDSTWKIGDKVRFDTVYISLYEENITIYSDGVSSPIEE